MKERTIAIIILASLAIAAGIFLTSEIATLAFGSSTDEIHIEETGSVYGSAKLSYVNYDSLYTKYPEFQSGIEFAHNRYQEVQAYCATYKIACSGILEGAPTGLLAQRNFAIVHMSYHKAQELVLDSSLGFQPYGSWSHAQYFVSFIGLKGSIYQFTVINPFSHDELAKLAQVKSSVKPYDYYNRP